MLNHILKSNVSQKGSVKASGAGKVIIKGKGLISSSFDKSNKVTAKPYGVTKKLQTTGIPTHAAVTGTQSIVNSSTHNLHANMSDQPKQ